MADGGSRVMATETELETREEQLPTPHIPAWEIVIARYSEQLQWIPDIPDSWDSVVILNKVKTWSGSSWP